MKTLFQLQYEFGSPDAYTEQGTNQGAKLLMDEVDDAEVREILADTRGLDTKEWLHWLRDNQERHPVMMVLPMTTLTPESTHYRFEGLHPHIVFIQRPLHTIEKLNEVLYAVNECIETGTYLVCHTMTARLKRTQTEQRYPWGVRTVVVGTQYLCKYINFIIYYKHIINIYVRCLKSYFVQNNLSHLVLVLTTFFY